MIKHHNNSKYTIEYDKCIYNNDTCYNNKNHNNNEVITYWVIILVTTVLMTIPTIKMYI